MYVCKYVCMYVCMHVMNFQTFLATYLPNTAAEEISDIFQLLEYKILYGQEKLSSKLQQIRKHVNQELWHVCCYCLLISRLWNTNSR